MRALVFDHDRKQLRMPPPIGRRPDDLIAPTAAFKLRPVHYDGDWQETTAPSLRL